MQHAAHTPEPPAARRRRAAPRRPPPPLLAPQARRQAAAGRAHAAPHGIRRARLCAPCRRAPP
eukprot:13428-Chlamydomonas_euryale.AAC.1